MNLLKKIPFWKSKTPKVMQQRSFEGARHSRLTADWLTGQKSLDHDLRYQLQTLINRSRSLEENNEYVAGFLRLLENNVLGANPFVLQMKIKEPDGRHDRIAEQAIEDAWKDWAKPANCTTSGMMSLADVYRVALRGMARDGAPLIRKHTGRQYGKYGFQLQPLDIDYLDVEHNEELRNGNLVRMGVEVDGFGRAVAYHLLGSHPGDVWFSGGKNRTRVLAGAIIHPYIQTRANQTRGYPALAASMMGLRHLGAYKEAEIVAARTNASKMGFLKKTLGENAQYAADSNDQGGKYMDAEAGSIEELPAGLDFVSWDPKHPTNQFGDFMKECLRGIASSLGVSYMTFANDAGDASYSSARIGMLEEREGYKMLQGWFISHICEDVFADWLDAALALEKIGNQQSVLPFSKFDKFNKPFFQGRRWQWVDPKNEVEGIEKALSLGITSPSRIIAEQGDDEEEVLDEIRQTQTERAGLGLLDSNTLEAIRLGKKMATEEEKPPLIASIGVGGVQALSILLPQIASGEISIDAGIEILVTVFGFTPEQARKIARRGQPQTA